MGWRYSSAESDRESRDPLTAPDLERLPKPPYRATYLHQADGQHSRGGPSFAIKPVRSASIPRSGRKDTLACTFRPIGLSGVAQIVTRQQQPILNAERVSLRSAKRDREVTHCARRLASLLASSRRALDGCSGSALPIRSPPYQAWASPCLRSRLPQDGASILSWPDLITPVHDRANCPSSQPDPHEFIGGFERMAIACFHGETDKRKRPRSSEANPAGRAPLYNDQRCPGEGF